MTTPEEFAKRRRALEHAHDIFRGRPKELTDEWLAEAGQALDELAMADTTRVVKLRFLVDTFRRGNQDAYAALQEPVSRVLENTLPTTERQPPPRPVVEEAKRHLDDAVVAEGAPRLEERHWRQLTRESGQLFGFGTSERTFSARCNDEQKAWKTTPDGRHVESRVIVGEFWSNQPPSAFVDYVDPRRWPDCSSFWREMRQHSLILAPNGNYDGVFAEVVDTGDATLEVPIEVGFRMRDDLSRVWVRFNLHRKTYLKRMGTDSRVKVDVDTGTVSAESMPGGPAPTRVRATKYLHAAVPEAVPFPELLCDLGWPEMMVAMAFRCSQEGPSEVAAAGAAARATAAAAAAAVPADVAVGRFVERVIGECQDGIGHTSPYVQSLIGRFTGPSWDLGWINDLLGIGMVTTERYGRVLSHVRGLADDLGTAAEQRGRP
jgi:hypothetical protein